MYVRMNHFEEVRIGLIDNITRENGDEVLELMTGSEIAGALWRAEIATLSELFEPVNTCQDFDNSAADYSLMCLIARATGCDVERMVDVFCKSKLVRPKFIGNKAYRDQTIRGAILWVKSGV